MNFGALTCVNHSLLLYYFPIPGLSLGRSEAPQSLSQQAGRCVVCLKKVQWPAGIFCGNFIYARHGYSPCNHVWCGECYISNPNVKFHCHRAEDLIEEQMGQNLDQPRIQQVWGKKLRNKLDFIKGRDGDHLLIPFECDRCIFLKLKHTLPDASKPSDQLLLATIRRMNLDAFWSRESSTVKSNLNRVKRMLDSSNSLGLNGPFKVQPPFPLYDHCGYEVALIILLRSRHPGKHHNSYTQFDTIRSYRASYSNFIRSTTTNTSITRSLGDSNGNYQRFAEDECASLF